MLNAEICVNELNVSSVFPTYYYHNYVPVLQDLLAFLKMMLNRYVRI